MKQRRFDQFTQIFLVNASQMAYLEEAHGTQAMLQKFNELFRYFIKMDVHVNLSEEINALKNYVDIQKTRYGNRFHITFTNCDNTDDILINHLSIFDFFDYILNNALVQYENTINFDVEIITARNISLRVTLRTDREVEEFNRILLEEGDAGA
jgi:LytS/YehU family sensor histidine kinase